MRMLIVDFETRSPVDLIKHGTDYYASDPNTMVLCMCAALLIDNELVQVWEWKHHDKTLPLDLLDAIEQADYIAAHNAAFDAAIWTFAAVLDHGFPYVAPAKWYCTSAQCRVNALPASLDAAARAIDASQKKDYYGSTLVKKVCCPDKDGNYDDDPLLFKQLVEYCAQDVRATAAIVQQTRLMTASEHHDYIVSENINNRGVRIDRALASAACSYADQEKAEIDSIISEITYGTITKHSQKTRAVNWVRDQLGDKHEIVKAMVKYVKGEKKYSLDDAARERVMLCKDCPETSDILDVVDLIAQGSKSSVSKFQAMINRADPVTDRVYGAFIYAGAGQTLRFSSRGLQLHNFRRDCFSAEDAERLKDQMLAGEVLTDCEDTPLSVLDTLSQLLRPAIIPSEGWDFVVCDWNAIEARVLPWLADSPEADEYLDIFRSGRCVYTENAKIVGSDDRQMGKIIVLALGFGGGEGALASAAKIYGMHFTELEQKEIKETWRDANQWAVKFWNQLETAAKSAVRYPGELFEAGRVKYIYNEDLLEGTLICELPGGHYIQYPKAKIEMKETPWGEERPTLTCLKASVKAKREDKEWPRVKLWRGALVENVTQAFAGVLLRDSLARLEDSKVLRVVAHTHDEIICEAGHHETRHGAELLHSVMMSDLDYTEGLPLEGEVTIMSRYGK